VVVVNTLTADVEREAVALPAHPLPALTRRWAVGRRTRNQRRELQIVPAVQRKLHDATVFDHRANRGVAALNEGLTAPYFDRLSQVTELQRDRDAIGAADLDLDVTPLHHPES